MSLPFEASEPGSSDWVELVKEQFAFKETEILPHNWGMLLVLPG